ncbi:MAG: hypothetical protein Q3Y17_04465 [Blautia sp.]|nr:hypothetical protein [Blautia sp.]
MAQSVGQIGLDLVVNQNQFKKQMSGITGLAKKAGVALASAFAVKKLVDFGKQCIELGSDLAEVQNVVDVTFPSMSKQVDEFAQSAASSFGLSETMAKQFTGTFGAMAKAFGFSEQQAYDMSTTLTGLAGDVASFYNISQDEAYTKLKSVFTGETESLKDLGIVMTQSALDAYAMANGFGKTTQAMSEAEKVALRYQFVQDQLTTASGDFARTSDGWANQVRVLKLQFDSLKATLGQGLINILTPVLKVLNQLLAKLMTVASVFKSFTEMLTGKKAESGSGFEDTASDLSAAAGAADSLTESTEGIGKAAEKTSRSLMGFDKINKLQDKNAGDTGGGAGVGSMDFDSLAEGDTVIDQTNQMMDGLVSKCHELASLCKKGFFIGFGNSQQKIESIKQSIKGIGQSFKDIFTDREVISAAEKLFNAMVYNAGRAAGSMASIGVTIADNLIGGIDGYLKGSKDYIKSRLKSIFNVSSEISDLAGDLIVALADIFSVFSGDNAKSITSSLIGIFSDGFLGVIDIAEQFSRDILNTVVQPIVDNKDKIKEAIDNTLAPIAESLEILHQGVKDTFEKMSQVYDEHIQSMFQAFADGFSDIVGKILDGYEKYIVPVLEGLSDRFGDIWENSVQPMINEAIDLIGKLADLIKLIWEKVLAPLISWIAKNIMPVIAPILERMGNRFLNLLEVISGVIGGILTVLGGLIDFIVGVFTGDWTRAWKGLVDIVKGVFKGFASIVKVPINAFIDMINKMIGGLNKIKVPGWVPGLGGKGINIPKIPKLAQGGFVKANTPRLAMIGDNRHYGEIVAPEDKLQAMVNTAVKATGGSGLSKADVESIVNSAVTRFIAAVGKMGFFVDGELLARALDRALENAKYRQNPVEVT